LREIMCGNNANLTDPLQAVNRFVTNSKRARLSA
jgi:hypothetical protein